MLLDKSQTIEYISKEESYPCGGVMSQFYTNVLQYGNKLLVRETKQGRKMQRRVPFKPTLFVKSQKETKYKSIFGEHLEPVEFQDINDAKQFVNNYTEVENFDVFGNTNYAYQYITENYWNEVDYDLAHMTILTLDIETSSENGFPNSQNPLEEILLITFQDNSTKKITTFGTRPFDTDNIQHITHKDNFEYVECANEVELLKQCLKFWKIANPDIITGWNIETFDMPYLVNRIRRVLSEEWANELSPWGIVKDKTIFGANGREEFVVDILGVSNLDYLNLYKKFTYTKHESYKLDFIANHVLEKKKLENPYETFKEFYTKDWQLFVEYNVIDVELVDQLEDRMKLIELIITMAYDAKCNFSDIFSAVRTWDCILYNHLWQQNIVVQQKVSHEARKIEGAYVKEPVAKKYDWVVSFDAASLYPSIIMSYNMSPETLVSSMVLDTTPEILLGQKVDFTAELQKKEVAMAANGHCFTTKRQGLFPEIVEKIYNERVIYKKKMIEAQKDYEKTKDPKQQKLISKYNNIQLARKIQLNSLYGAWANKYFRFYDDKIAEGITLTGQYIIRYVGNAIDTYLNSICKTTGVEYTFYSDTDSCYVTLDNLVQKYWANNEKEKVVEIIDKFCKEKMSGILQQACEEMMRQTNGFKNHLEFKREVIADHGLWIAKKMYALNVYDSEGVRYKTPKLKVLGLQLVRSSTPSNVRQYLRDAVKIALTGTQTEMHTFIANVEEKFFQMSVEDIAFPRSANNLAKYSSPNTIYLQGKSTPIQVRASLLHNHYLKQRNLDKKYERIKEGDKIKFVYLQKPNTIGENCIAFIGKLPKELELHKVIDYNTMFEKSFLLPMQEMLVYLGWTTKEVATFEGFF